MTAPVTKEAWSESSHTTRWAISSGSAIRPCGVGRHLVPQRPVHPEQVDVEHPLRLAGIDLVQRRGGGLHPGVVVEGQVQRAELLLGGDDGRGHLRLAHLRSDF